MILIIEGKDRATIVDREIGDRFGYIVETGRLLFKNSSLVDPSKEITKEVLELIDEYHKAVSPVNPDHLWRLERQEKSLDKGEIVDPSTYGNWEAPGGPMEHINLTKKTAELLAREIQSKLKDESNVNDSWSKKTINEIKKINPYHAAAAGAFHDEGRETTHIFYSNEIIGARLLQRIGIRQDIIDILPSESVMLTPEDQSMDEVIKGLSPEAVILRIADEFGKRAPGKNRLFQTVDYDERNQEAWAQRYVSKPFSGRPSDKKMREKIGLHNRNARRYFESLDNWVKSVSTLDLQQLTQKLDSELSRTLLPLDIE